MRHAVGRKQAIRGLVSLSVQGTRDVQEDFVLSSPERNIFVVADGFGGSSAGVDASRTACESVRAFLEKEIGDEDATLPFVIRKYYSLAANVLFNAVLHANRRVLVLNQAKNVQERGGASLLAGFLDGNHVALANVGSCVSYLWRAGRVTRLTTPRSYGQLVDPVEEHVEVSETRWRVPLSALGMTEDLEPEIYEFQGRPGDILAVGTSGREMTDILTVAGMARSSGERPLREALGSGLRAAQERYEKFRSNTSISLILL